MSVFFIPHLFDVFAQMLLKWTFCCTTKSSFHDWNTYSSSYWQCWQLSTSPGRGPWPKGAALPKVITLTWKQPSSNDWHLGSINVNLPSQVQLWRIIPVTDSPKDLLKPLLQLHIVHPFLLPSSACLLPYRYICQRCSPPLFFMQICLRFCFQET